MKKVIILMVVMLAATCLMAETNFYGSLRTGWWYTMENEDYSDSGEANFDFALNSYSGSRVGMDYTKDGFTAKIEMGLGESNVSLRHAYGEQDLGMFKVLIGRTYSGFSDFAAQGYGPNSDIYLSGYGMMYDKVNTQIRFTLPNSVYISLIQPKKMPFISGTYSNDMDAVIPKINVGMHYKLGEMDLHPTFGFAMAKYNEDESTYDESIIAYAFALTGKNDLNNIKLQWQIGFGQNIDDYGFCTRTENSDAQWINDEIVNATTISAYLQGMYDAFTFGGGYVMDNNDELDDADATMTLFGQYKIKLGNICVMPEIGMINYMEDGMGEKEGNVMYFGTQLRVSIP